MVAFLFSHIFFPLEFKHPQDSEKPKEESQHQLEWLWPGCHREWPCVWAATAPGALHCFPTIQECGCCSIFIFQISHKMSLCPGLIRNHSGRELWEHSFSSVKWMDTVRLQSNLLEKIWPALSELVISTWHAACPGSSSSRWVLLSFFSFDLVLLFPGSHGSPFLVYTLVSVEHIFRNAQGTASRD